MEANMLRKEEVTAEMERRGLNVKGFFEDDAKALQRAYDAEFALEFEKLKEERKEQRKQDRKKAQLQKKRLQLEKQLREEEEAVAEDEDIATWLEQIRINNTWPTARIRSNSITARAVAKALWDNTSLTCLDLSRNKLSDFAGSQIGRALRRNCTLLKLEVNDNFLGPRSCRSFGEALPLNSTIKYVDLESNPLVTGPDGAETTDTTGFFTLAQAFRKNTSLTAMSLWRCNVGHQCGAEIANCLDQNTSITSIDVGNNSIYFDDLRKIKDIMERNQALKKEKDAADEAERAKEEAEEQRLQDIKDQEQKAQDLEQWMLEQRDQRANDRMTNAIAERERRKTEEIEKQKIAEDLRLEKKLAAEAAKKKKNKKKKGAK